MKYFLTLLSLCIAFIMPFRIYTPRTRAILGAILSNNGDSDIAENLKISLNPATKYKLGISDLILTNKHKWNIE